MDDTFTSSTVGTGSIPADKPTRIRRPDQSVIDPEPGTQPSSGDAPAIENDKPAEPGESTAGEALSSSTVRSDFVEGSAPYHADGIIVMDAGGRHICNVASQHSTLEHRHKVAAWIAEKLNHKTPEGSEPTSQA